MNDFSETTVIIPTLNEEQNIGMLVHELKKGYPEISIIVTDDGSSDKTRERAQESGAAVIDRTNEKVKGITAAVLDAVKAVRTENIVVMDADFQHPPGKVGAIIEMLEIDDMVIGVRERVVGPWGMLRKTESKVATALALLRLGKRVKDPMSGFFGIKTKLLNQMNKKNFELRCFKILFNILKNIDLEKTKIGSVLYDFNIRKHGESKIGAKAVFYFVKNLLK